MLFVIQTEIGDPFFVSSTITSTNRADQSRVFQMMRHRINGFHEGFVTNFGAQDWHFDIGVMIGTLSSSGVKCCFAAHLSLLYMKEDTTR